MNGVATARAGLAAMAAGVVALAGSGGVAAAASGGVEGPSGSGDGSEDVCVKARFGDRALERGDCGSDVTTLNWLLKARKYGVALDPQFGRTTHRSVRDFQGKRGIASSGVVNRRTRKELVAGMRRHLASWYGPGFFGNTTACGQTLRRKTRGVAHRSLPCGTRVVVSYGGRLVRTRVIDRGPYVKRRYERDWDLTEALAKRLRFSGVDHVRAAVIR